MDDTNNTPVDGEEVVATPADMPAEEGDDAAAPAAPEGEEAA